MNTSKHGNRVPSNKSRSEEIAKLILKTILISALILAMAIINNVWVVFLTGAIVSVFFGLKQMSAAGCSDQGIVFASTLCIVTSVFMETVLLSMGGYSPHMDATAIVISSMIMEFPVFMFLKSGKEKDQMACEMAIKLLILFIILLYTNVNIAATSSTRALVEIASENISNPLDARVVVYFIENGIPAILAGVIIATSSCMRLNKFSGKKYAKEIKESVLDEMTGKMNEFCDYMMAEG